MRKILLAAAGLALGGVALIGLLASGALERSVVSRAVETPLGADQIRALAPRGAAVAAAADCYACHTARGGAPWAGGMPFETPFGTIHATNISPSPEGIGGWSRAEFHRALRDGVAPGGRHLYPAMPYTSYRGMTEGDVDALYAYLITREKMPVANRPNGLAFPFDQRWTLSAWNLLNLPAAVAVPDPTRSDLWNRGRYVAEALGHCGECHTPRNLMQGLRGEAALTGAVIEGLEAPDITLAGLARMGFAPASLARFMGTGLSAQGGATHQMFEVVHYSTRHMARADLAAMAAYLFDRDAPGPEMDPAVPAAAPAPTPLAAAVSGRARASYDGLCAGCHGAQGEGIPHVSVALRTNAGLRTASPASVVRAVLAGLPAQTFPGGERMDAMPGFAADLDDAALADLTNWMRTEWGGQASTLGPQDMAAIRAAIAPRLAARN